MSTTSDLQLAAAAVGFSGGFGVLTVWEAIKQTRRNKSPLRSVYIYMIWGEIVANIGLGLMGWLFLYGDARFTIPNLLLTALFWSFEVQLLMQIIINRILLIAENRRKLQKLKWGTAAIMTAINISVFCIWTPAHKISPVPAFVAINKYWDPTTKCLVLIVDAFLNWYFLRIVKTRLLKNNGLMKYKPLVAFNQ